MQATSFLLSIVLIVGAYEVRQALSSAAAAAEQVLGTLEMTNCDDLKLRLACFQRKYRTFDGTCNNLCNITIGSAGRPLQRLLPNAYQQPGNQPRSQSVIPNKPLVNARTISQAVFTVNNGANINQTAPNFTHLTMTWGQFLDHDVTLTELTPGVECGTNNEPCPQNPDCIGIDINADNQLQNNPSVQCIPLRRSFRNEDGEQINELTSYIDGSQVYGSDDNLANRLRNPKDKALLDDRLVPNTGERPRLPPSDPEAFCRSPNRTKADCFLAGDIRVNENHALMAMHTLWVREHNRIVSNLRYYNPYWCDEKLFQEARRIVIAEMQHITYNEWLAVLFDEELRKSSGLLLEPDGTFFTGYDPAVNPEMLNSFSTAALRMGHSLIRNTFALRPVSAFNQPRSLQVSDMFNPIRFFEEENVYGGIFEGLTRLEARNFDHFFVEAIGLNLIVEGPGPNGTLGADLPAINIQRGRDHGLPGYAAYREALGGGAVVFFSDLRTTISQARINRLKEVYAAAKDIDIFAGSINEFPVRGSIFGHVFTALLTKQFKASRFGDRFWYERNDPQIGFTQAQLSEIRKSSMARVICDNTDIVFSIQRKAFRPESDSNPMVPCSDVDRVNLKEFAEAREYSASEGAQESNSPVGVWA